MILARYLCFIVLFLCATSGLVWSQPVDTILRLHCESLDAPELLNFTIDTATIHKNVNVLALKPGDQRLTHLSDTRIEILSVWIDAEGLLGVMYYTFDRLTGVMTGVHTDYILGAFKRYNCNKVNAKF